MAKLVVIIQCDIVQKKCVGYACMKSFYERSGDLPVMMPIPNI